jgi:hypothetical protein
LLQQKSMSPSRLERERPSEWLRWLAEEPHAYSVLVTYAGGLARAAYRMASVRCRLQGMGDAPTLRELQAAAQLISQALGRVETLPISSLLASDLEAQGLPVIRPVAKAPPRVSSRPPLRRAS